MTKAALKKELHKAIDQIEDDSILEAVYTILNYNGHLSTYVLNKEDIRIIEERKASYKSGKAKMLTPKQVREKVLKKMTR